MRRIVVAALLFPLVSQGYILPARSVFRRFAEKQALDRVKGGALAGRATLADVGGKELEMPVKLDVALPGGCTARLEAAEGTIVTGFQAGKQTAEGEQIPALAAFVALGCGVSTMKNVPAAEAELLLVRLASALAVDLNTVSISRLGKRVAWVVGAKPRETERAQVWFDKETNRPIRIIAKQAGQWWDVRLTDPISNATGRRFPRLVEVWQRGDRKLALKLMATDEVVEDAPAAGDEDAEAE